MDAQMTFKRYELKYMLTRRQVQALRQAMDGHMALDRFGHSEIRSVYLDTDNFRLIRRSLERPLYKEKLRVRAYRKAGVGDPVFVELKKKFEGVVYKRRLMLPNAAAMEALEGGAPLPASLIQPGDAQIAREIEAFRSFYGPTLRPAMLITCEREAFYPTDGVDFRVTLDENLLWRDSRVDLGTSLFGTSILNPDQVLMELKTPGGIPLWMARFLTENRVPRVSFSKYGTAYRQMLAAENMTGGRRYA